MILKGLIIYIILITIIFLFMTYEEINKFIKKTGKEITYKQKIKIIISVLNFNFIKNIYYAESRNDKLKILETIILKKLSIVQLQMMSKGTINYVRAGIVACTALTIHSNINTLEITNNRQINISNCKTITQQFEKREIEV